MTAWRWSGLALASAVVTVAVLAFAPVVTTRACVASPHQATECSSTRTSLVAHEGAGVLAGLAVPAVVAVVPVVAPSRASRLAAAALLTAAGLLAVASVGVFLAPTVVLAWVATTAGGAGTG